MTTQKLKDLIHYVCWKCDDPKKLGATKLHKIVWLADLSLYLETGSTITGAEYEKRQNGPVPRGGIVARTHLEQDHKIVARPIRVGPYDQHSFVAIEPPDMTAFSRRELDLIDAIIDDVCNNHSAASISDASHEIVWRAAVIGETIPLYAYLASQATAPTDDDLVWADAAIARLEGHDGTQ